MRTDITLAKGRAYEPHELLTEDMPFLERRAMTWLAAGVVTLAAGALTWTVLRQIFTEIAQARAAL